MTRKELEQIKEDILQKFNTKYKLNEQMKIMTRNEFINTEHPQAPYKYYRIQISKDSKALNFLNGESIILIPEKTDYDTGDLLEVIISSFHELRHTYQIKKLSLDPFYNFLMQIEFLMKIYNQPDYIYDHDSFYHEIDAKKYSFIETQKYFLTHFPNQFKYMEASLYLQYKNEYYHIKELVDKYEPHNTVDKLVYAIQKKVISPHNTQIPPIMYNFLNEDGTYKPLAEIINNKNLRLIDERILLAVLSSRTFISTININKLTPKEKMYLRTALQKAEEQIKQGIKTSTNNKTIQKEYKKQLKIIGYKIAPQDTIKQAHKEITKKLNSITNTLRQEKKRENHKKQIPIYIKKLTRS